MTEHRAPERETSFTSTEPGQWVGPGAGPGSGLGPGGGDDFTLLTEEMAGPHPQPDPRTIFNGQSLYQHIIHMEWSPVYGCIERAHSLVISV